MNRPRTTGGRHIFMFKGLESAQDMCPCTVLCALKCWIHVSTIGVENWNQLNGKTVIKLNRNETCLLPTITVFICFGLDHLKTNGPASFLPGWRKDWQVVMISRTTSSRDICSLEGIPRYIVMGSRPTQRLGGTGKRYHNNYCKEPHRHRHWWTPAVRKAVQLD